MRNIQSLQVDTFGPIEPFAGDEPVYGLRFLVTLCNGRTFGVPVTWSTNDIARSNPGQVSNLIQSLVRNGVSSINDIIQEGAYDDSEQ